MALRRRAMIMKLLGVPSAAVLSLLVWQVCCVISRGGGGLRKGGE
jgi:hypothetical protein